LEEGDEFERESRRERAFWFFRSLFSFFSWKPNFCLNEYALSYLSLLDFRDCCLTTCLSSRAWNRDERTSDNSGRSCGIQRGGGSGESGNSIRRPHRAPGVGCCSPAAAVAIPQQGLLHQARRRGGARSRTAPGDEARGRHLGEREGERERPDLKRGKQARSPIVKQRLSSTTFLLFFYPFSFG